MASSLWKWLTDYRKICSSCDGTGVVACHCNENNEILCPNCNGKGSIEKRVVVTQKMEVPCDHPGCEQGKVQCGICHGTGTGLDGASCSECRGKGEVDCPVCFGINKIHRDHQETWTEHTTCHLCHGCRYVPCPLCHGTKEKVCPECKGRGIVANKGKLSLVVAGVVLVALLPTLFIAVAGLMIGYCLFRLWRITVNDEQKQEK